jgi:hypothetical protein
MKIIWIMSQSGSIRAVCAGILTWGGPEIRIKSDKRFEKTYGAIIADSGSAWHRRLRDAAVLPP